MESSTFDDAASAYEKVRTTIANLKSQYRQVSSEVAATQSALDSAPLLRVPLDDLKAGVLEFVDACGERYAQDAIRAAISNFARNNTGSSSRDPALSGKPLRYCDLDTAIAGGDRDYGTQLATPSKHQFDDRALYFLVAPLVKERLAALMEEMSPSDFGYDGIHPDKIGSDRATRRKEIEALRAKLDELKARQNDLGQKLVTLGVSPLELRQLDAASSVNNDPSSNR